MPLAIDANDVRAAAERIRPLARQTPTLTSADFDTESGARVFFKCENLQRGGAFKIRGASNLILSLPPETVARGMVAYSSGNHAQAVAIAARHVGGQATIVMPEDAPRSKMEATRAQGARIVTYNRFTENREALAGAILKESGATLVPPFDHPMIMAGQGTAALELLNETGPLDALVTPVGGGGLLSGCATIAKAIHPKIRMFGAEPEGANDTFLSMMAGERVAVPHVETDRRWIARAEARRTDVPDREKLGGADCIGERRRDPRGGEISVAAPEDSGGTKRRRLGGRGAVSQVARRNRIRGSGALGRKRGFRRSGEILRWQTCARAHPAPHPMRLAELSDRFHGCGSERAGMNAGASSIRSSSQEFRVAAGLAELVEQQFHGFNRRKRIQHFSQNPDAVELVLGQ